MRKPWRSLGKPCASHRIECILYGNLADYNLALQRFDEARQIIHEAQARKLDDGSPRCSLRSCLSRGGLRGDGGTATVVCG